MEEKIRPRRRNVSIKIDQTLSYDFPREERKKREPALTRSLFSGLVSSFKAPFKAVGEARHYRQEIKKAESHYHPKTSPRKDPLKPLSTDNIYWKLIYPLPVNIEMGKISSEISFIKSKLQGYEPDQLRNLKIHAHAMESRSQVVWAIYVILLFAIGLYGHSFITQPYFLAFFLFCLVVVLVLFYRYVRSRFLVAIVKEVVNDILNEEKKTNVY